MPGLRFKHAIARKPARNFADGLSTAHLGAPDYEKALLQHAHYCEALKACGLTLTMLNEDPAYPDSTFVEDTAVLTLRSAILARPGAQSRAGEVAAISGTLRDLFARTHAIEAPGTLDGGDICEAENHFFIGLSHRTNEEGAHQLAGHLEREGYTTSMVDIRGMTSILHLKSGIASIGDNTLVVMEEMAGNKFFAGYDLIRVIEAESYAANCVRVNERVLVPAGFSLLTSSLEARGFNPLVLDVSEFRKMDGGLSCLSLRF